MQHWRFYLKRLYPQLPIEYYNTDTKCELAETEKLIENLKSYLGHIEILVAAEDSPEPTPLTIFLKLVGDICRSTSSSGGVTKK